MAMEQLLAVQFYCDDDHLRYALSATFYPQSAAESVANWKLRHSEYGHWSHFLRDAVDSGHALDIGGGAEVLFHSTTNHAFLAPKALRCRYPMACSSRFGVAHCFCPQNGIVLELKQRRHWQWGSGTRRSPLDCRWISDFPDFGERLVFERGDRYRRSSGALTICNLLNVGGSTDYGMFWSALSLFQRVIDGEKVSFLTDSDLEEAMDRGNDGMIYGEEDVHCLSLMIEWQLRREDRKRRRRRSQSISLSLRSRSKSSEYGDRRSSKKCVLRIPPFIEALFDWFCRHSVRGQITLCPSDFVAVPLVYKLLFDNFGSIKLDLFCALFCGVESVRILRVVLNDYIFEALLQFLAQSAASTSAQREGRRRSSILGLLSSSTSITPNIGGVGQSESSQSRRNRHCPRCIFEFDS